MLKIVYAALCSAVFASTTQTVFAEDAAPPAATTPAASDQTPATVAPKVKKRVKKAAAAAAAIENTDGEVALTGANKQEPKLGPYKSEVSFAFSYTSGSGTRKSEDISYKLANSEMDLSVTYQFILGRFSVGPVFSYTSGSRKETIPESDGIAASTTEVKSSSMGYGVAGQFYIANVQTEKLVPFVGLKLVLDSGSQSSTSSTDDSSRKVTASGSTTTLSGGVKFFLTRHVSIDPALAYSMKSVTDKDPDQESTTKTTDNAIQLVAGLSILL